MRELSRLYDRWESAERLLHDAHLPEVEPPQNLAPRDRWHRIIKQLEDERPDRLAALLRTVIDDIGSGGNETLEKALADLEQGQRNRDGQAAGPVPAQPAGPASAPRGQWINPRRVAKPFIPRSDLLRRVEAALDDDTGVPLIALAGLGGIGKTQLAARYCHTALEDGRLVIWLRAEDRFTLVQELSRLCTQLGLEDTEEQSEEQIVTHTKEYLEQLPRRWLMVLDNVERTDDVRDLFPAIGNGAVLATTRNRNLTDFECIEVTAIDDHDSAAHLVEVTGQDDLDGAYQLAWALGGLPLALAHAGRYIKEHRVGFTEYRDSLENLPARELLAEAPTAFYEGTIASTWQRSIQAAGKVSALAAGLLARLSLVESDRIPRELIDGESAELALNVSRTELLRAAGALNRYSLIDLEERQAAVHRMVQKVTRDEALHTGSARHRLSELLAIVGHAFKRCTAADDPWAAVHALYPHLMRVRYWIGLSPYDHDVSLRSELDEVTILGLDSGLRSLATTPIERVGNTGDAFETLRVLRGTAPDAPLSGPIGVLLGYSLGERDQSPEDSRVCRALVERGTDEEVATVLFVTVHGRRADGLRLFLAQPRQERVTRLLQARPTWTGCVRFVCANPQPDPTGEAVLKAAVKAGDHRATTHWLHVIKGGRRRSRRRLERELSECAQASEHVTMALVRHLKEQGRDDDAIAALRRGLHLGPRVPIALAAALARAGQAEEAKDVLGRFAAELPDAAVRLARFLRDEGKSGEAERVLRPFAGLAPHATVELARMLQLRGERDEAVTMLARSARISPVTAVELSKVHMRGRNPVAAAEVLRPFLRKDINVDKQAANILQRAPKRELARVAAVLDTRRAAPPARPRGHRREQLTPTLLSIVRELAAEGRWQDVVRHVTPGAAPHHTSYGAAVVTTAKKIKDSGDAQVARRLLKHFDTLPMVVVHLARRRAKDGAHEDALAMIAPLAEAAETDETLALQISKLQWDLGRPEDALATATAARPQTIPLLQRRSDILVQLDRAGEALELLIPHADNDHIAIRVVKLARAHALTEGDREALERMAAAGNRRIGAFLTRASNTELAKATAAADSEWFFGDPHRAIGLYRPMAAKNLRTATRLVACLTSLDDHSAALDFLGAAVPGRPELIPLLIEVCAEAYGLAEAQERLGEHARHPETVLGLAWLAMREGRGSRVHDLAAQMRGSETVQSISHLIKGDLTDPDRARRLARQLWHAGMPGFAEDVLKDHESDRDACVDLAELVRTRLDFPRSRELLAGFRRHHLPAACGTAVSWLRNGDPDRAVETLEEYQGPPVHGLTEITPLLRTVRTDPRSAVTVAKRFYTWQLPRCVFEVLQVAGDDHPALKDMRKVVGLSPQEVKAVERVRTRALFHDRRREIRVWPDFREDLRQVAIRRRIQRVHGRVRGVPPAGL